MVGALVVVAVIVASSSIVTNICCLPLQKDCLQEQNHVLNDNFCHRYNLIGCSLNIFIKKLRLFQQTHYRTYEYEWIGSFTLWLWVPRARGQEAMSKRPRGNIDGVQWSQLKCSQHCWNVLYSVNAIVIQCILNQFFYWFHNQDEDFLVWYEDPSHVSRQSLSIPA